MSSADPGDVALADLLEDGLFIDGDWVESKDQDPAGEVRLIQLADIGDGVFRDRSARSLTYKKAIELRCTFLEPGDVLVARMPEPLGRACIFPGVGQPAVTVVDVCVLRPNPERVRTDWLVWAVNSPDFRTAMQAFVRGTTRQRISRRNLGTLKLRAPSVDYQIDLARLLRGIDSKRGNAASHVAAARRALDRFRLSVLVTAYNRAATADPDGSVRVPLHRILREPLKNGYSAKPVSEETPFRVLTLTATTSGWFDESHFKYTRERFAPDSPFWLAPGDIIIQRGNTPEYVGVPALYDGPANAFLYPDLMIRVRVRRDIDPRFVWYMLLAPQSRRFLRDRATGSAGNMPKINQAILNEVPVPLPPAETREEIVAMLDGALAQSSFIGKRLELAAQKVGRSSPAVLAKAFRGDLTGTVR